DSTASRSSVSVTSWTETFGAGGGRGWLPPIHRFDQRVQRPFDSLLKRTDENRSLAGRQVQRRGVLQAGLVPGLRVTVAWTAQAANAPRSLIVDNYSEFS